MRWRIGGRGLGIDGVDVITIIQNKEGCAQELVLPPSALEKYPDREPMECGQKSYGCVGV